MKKIFALLIIGAFNSAAAHADNSKVEEALRSRPDLSSFYQALNSTGVLTELKPNMFYTVLAPNNDAFAMMTKERYPCFYSTECSDQVASILRNHIIPGEQYIADTAREKGGFEALNGQFIIVGEPNRGNYTVNGHNIIYMSWFGSGILYKINGLIATPQQLADLQALQTPVVEQSTTTITRETIPDPACRPEGCPDAVSETTTITRSYPTVRSGMHY